ncbi:predicted protein [Coccidioides posadasii str. Silveira]|uniref:Predicted protein n=1 Tax=Coccidioides posadasii (strain RMSCC 757 / Silveira) TaxID=443226 RepID=E9DBD9_COCPS|nr:predicted protein [Coccidioides posadasii str. Silveira]
MPTVLIHFNAPSIALENSAVTSRMSMCSEKEARSLTSRAMISANFARIEVNLNIIPDEDPTTRGSRATRRRVNDFMGKGTGILRRNIHTTKGKRDTLVNTKQLYRRPRVTE